MAKKSGLGKGLDALFLDNDSNEQVETTQLVRVGEIEPNKAQPRRNFDENALAELAESIREHGIIQPLLVRRLETGNFQLVAGERRWRAARMIGLNEVPVLVKDLSEVEVMEIALIENLQREDLNPLEQANGFRELMATYGMTQDEVAKRVGKSRSAIANSLRILNLPEQIRPYLVDGSLTLGHAKVLMGLDNEQQIIALGDEIAKKGISVRETERIVAKMKGNVTSPKGEEEKSGDHYFKELQLAMNEELGRKVKIKASASGKGVVEIAFYDKEDLASIAERLSKSY